MCLYSEQCNLYKNLLYKRDQFCRENYKECARYCFANEKHRDIPDEISPIEHWKINFY